MTSDKLVSPAIMSDRYPLQAQAEQVRDYYSNRSVLFLVTCHPGSIQTFGFNVETVTYI